ncbi:MAG: tRNA uridine-5-carboxymethylaminomethyl(34) synthesis GTPase MnmE [Candidatus Thiodiazotropha sp.]
MPHAVPTIAAVATPPGRGGVGIVRVSGANCRRIAEQMLGYVPEPRLARYTPFLDDAGDAIDQGIALFFPAPHSFTGEDVLELQGHGGPVVMDLLLQRVLQLGARLAAPGAFSERAFLNDKLDLVQAEAIADLIDAESAAAARLATRTLQGAFSRQIHELVERLIELRLYVESAIDFPEEEIDFLSDGKVSADLHRIISDIERIRERAATGRLLRDGMTLVIAGRPNAGKSSLLNALAGVDSAIVTEIPGTTRDLLHERITLDGLPLHIVDTAGLRDSSDPVEAEGIRRARAQIETADRILWVFDDQADPGHLALDRRQLPASVPLTLVRNKIDLSGRSPAVSESDEGIEVALAAKSGEGIDLLVDHLKSCVGYRDSGEGEFIARRRHLDALERALAHLRQGAISLDESAAGELLAEDLRLSQQALSEITGEFTADDLLGRIFSSFCIGK